MKQDSMSRSCLTSILITTALICGVYFIGDAYINEELKEKLLRWQITDKMYNGTDKMQNITDNMHNGTDKMHNGTDKMHNVANKMENITDNMHNATSHTCENLNKPLGTESLPQGIIVKTSNLETQHLWNYRDHRKRNPNRAKSLLAIAVGIKQKELVNKVIQKFPSRDFVVMLFHYDGVVDEWKQYPWNEHAIHVSVMNQTKWWFAKRFLHPDVVAEYEYIFLWDEDLGVSHFSPQRYLSIVKEEGLEISQPALDTTNTKSEVHHPITARRKNLKFHRRMYKNKGSGRCDDHSTDPPCIGWVEMMAPVFSRSAWRCSWYMIQNDLIHAWGLDTQLGYCAQGDRKKNVGVVDAEYIVHYGLPTLGVVETASCSSLNKTNPKSRESSSESREVDNRAGVRMKSYVEMKRFKERWKKAVEDDRCWVDPY